MLTPRLVMAGAGDFAREVLWTCTDIPADQRKWKSLCFIDDDVEAARSRMQRYGVDVPVIGSIQDFSPSNNDLMICTIAKPSAKLAICERLRARGGRFTNVIHPTAAIGMGTRLGLVL